MLGALIAARATDDEMWNGCGEFNFRHPDGGTIGDAEALAAAILKRPLRAVERMSAYRRATLNRSFICL
jgi:hypothetical protein